MQSGPVSLSPPPVVFACHDDPGAGEEEYEEQGVVPQVGPLAHTSQGIVLQDSLAVCACVGGGGWGGN